MKPRKRIGEFEFINKITRGCLVRSDGVLKAIGDDAAAFLQDGRQAVLVTTDLLVERVHFNRSTISGFNLGHKALAVNLSDIAAMGGTAREAFVSIAVPDGCPQDYLEALYGGIKRLAAEFDVNILGGDTTRAVSDLIINVTVVGVALANEILYRSAAREGDIVCCTGALGDSRAGLHLLLQEVQPDCEQLTALIAAHQLPRPMLREGRFLARQRGVHAAIDVSDGLSSDVGHIAEQSRAGIRLYRDQIPLSQDLQFFCARFGFDPVAFALSGGEDYCLLCTIAEDRAEEIIAAYGREFDRPLVPIGVTLPPGRMELADDDGVVTALVPTGWDHFKADGRPQD